MDNCANTYYINKHLEEQENAERLEEQFDDYIQAELGDIENAIDNIRTYAKDYQGNDMTERANELIKDLL